MKTNTEHTNWKGNTGGTPWMQRSLVRLFGVLDVRILYAVMALVVPFYMLFAPKGYWAQYRFFRQCFGFGSLKSFRYVYLNHYAFGKVILDRFAVYGGQKFLFKIDGEALYLQKLAQPDGFVQVSSHIGNSEIAGYLLPFSGKKIHALVFGGETETVMSNRAKAFAGNQVCMVPVMPDMSHIFTLNNALQQGDIVSMPGDRLFGSTKGLPCTFMGRQAQLPVGPFIMALQRNVSLVTLYVMKEKAYHYHVYVNEIALPLQADNLTKRQQLAYMAQQFASGMEQMVKKYPTQWFNYFDFWNQ